MLLVGFPVHEFAHALAAYRLGDSTARFMGRLTLNPIVHFDPLGGILLAVTFIAARAFGFGWAKPTPVNPNNLEGGRRGEAIVAAAGPISNLVLAVAAALPLRYIIANPDLAEQIPLIVIEVMFYLRVHQPRADGVQPVPDPAARRVEGPLRLPAAAGRLALAAGPRAVRVHPAAARLLLPPGDSIGGRILLPIIDGTPPLLVGI